MEKFHVQVKKNSSLVEANMNEEIHVQAKDNSPSIESLLRPISYTAWLLGVGIARPRKCPKAITIIIRMIHMAVCSYTMIRNTKVFYSIIFSIQSHYSDDIQIKLETYIHLFMLITCYTSTYYYIYHGIRQYNKWPELMDRLKELDQKIRKEISMNDQSIKIVEALSIFMTFFLCPLMPIIRVLYYYLTFKYLIPLIVFINIMLFYYILAQSLINCFVINVVVYVLYCRFQTVNKLIGQLNELSDVQRIAFKIRRIKELHADICDLASMVNDIHGLHLLFCSANCFTTAVNGLFTFYNDINTSYMSLMITSVFEIVYAMQFWLICWTCTIACQESNKSGKLIHKIILNCKLVNLDMHEASNQSSLEMRSALEDLNSDQTSNCSSSHNPFVVENFLRRNLDRECITKEINDFSIQLQQNRIAFTACNFFEINNASFGCFVGVIVSYLIIVLQYSQDFNNLLKKHILKLCSENAKNITLDYNN